MWDRARKSAIWVFIIILGLSTGLAQAKLTTSGQAQMVVQTWLALAPRPLNTAIGQEVKRVKTYFDESGLPVYYVVHLKPSGLVLVPADDLVEPIIGFSPGKVFNPSPANSLGALASRDLTGRVHSARETEAKAQAMGVELYQEELAAAQHKWALLLDQQPELFTLAAPILDIDINNPRVDPLLPNYNWWQIPFWAVPLNNYVPAGCVAVAMGQVMRKHGHPASSKDIQRSVIIKRGNKAVTYSPELPEVKYNWAGMPLNIPKDPNNPDIPLKPRASSTLNIGAILHDAGMSVGMNYGVGASGIAVTAMGNVAVALTTNFNYGNAVHGFASSRNLSSNNRNKMINPNLDAGLPVILAITGVLNGKRIGHAVVADGYGYNITTPYHHLNLGWGDNNVWWYNLPNIPEPTYDTVTNCIYNIFKTGQGEIISGRVVDVKGNGLSGVSITATHSSTTLPAVKTIKNGIYALKNIPSNTQVVVKAKKAGYDPPPALTVTTGISANGKPITGNVWPVNFEMVETQ